MITVSVRVTVWMMECKVEGKRGHKGRLAYTTSSPTRGFVPLVAVANVPAHSSQERDSSMTDFHIFTKNERSDGHAIVVAVLWYQGTLLKRQMREQGVDRICRDVCHRRSGGGVDKREDGVYVGSIVNGNAVSTTIGIHALVVREPGQASLTKEHGSTLQRLPYWRVARGKHSA